MINTNGKKRRLSNDALEWSYIEQFRAVYQFFPSGRLIKGTPGQEPDFVIKFDDMTSLGIELAQLYRDEGDDLYGVLHQARFQTQLVEAARRQFESESLNRYRIYISFHERSGITRSNQNDLVRFLVSTVHAAIANRTPTRERPIQLGSSALHPFENTFSLVQIYHHAHLYDFEWTVSNVFSVESLNKNVLLSRIREKERNLAKGLYGSLTKCWLLLCMDFSDHAMDQHIPEGPIVTLSSSGFDKIIVFKTIEKTCKVIHPFPS